jgi:hypothetical protein
LILCYSRAFGGDGESNNASLTPLLEVRRIPLYLGREIQMKILIAILFFHCILPFNVHAETPEEYKLKDSDLGIESAKLSLNSVETALKDFRDFTGKIITDEVLEESGKKPSINLKVKSEDLEGFSKSLNWSIQNIGFHNWVVTVRGSLLKLDYIAKKNEYELAKCNHKVTKEELLKLYEIFLKAQKEYQRFMSVVVLAD